ncbi:MAG: hypothetical protein P1V18_00520 [Candidatus Gracilibacteria bacterium]|nr:hypothetical protein [Candidatus Gracilibacteria bacterium]
MIFFLFILGGVFFGVVKFYPQLAMHYYEEFTNEEMTTNTPSTPAVADVPTELAPFVRGVLSGIKTAQLASRRESGALDVNKTQGYLQGMRTALITSRNWYDLDRQLFRAQGLPLGIRVAVETSKPVQERSTLEYQIKLIDTIQKALSVNLEDLLDGNTDRARALTSYLNGLKNLSEESRVEIENMTRIVAEYQAVVDQNLALSTQASGAFVTDTDNFITDNLDANFSQFLEARQRADEARIRVTSTQRILSRLQPLSSRLPDVISAIEANYDALASGIKVSPQQGVNLPIFQ